ncbi:hypothetical protein AeMF1_002987 [Aphanomyces euteiches]|nr:hypothetical protein AeMF1_002987 [Aphanomyces euteiches]KAH9185984.1 hypothetical protein AeNC1_012043 [Aphanomyces euteiches]
MRGEMTSSLQIKSIIAAMEGVQGGSEIVVYHPIHESIVSITSTLLQEIDIRTASLVGEINFDGSLLGDKPNAFECAVACGSKYVVASLSRCLVIWDLHEMVLIHIVEVAAAAAITQKTKHISALTASLCSKNLLYFAHEGSQSIKATSVDALCSGDLTMKKLHRKVASRSSAIITLAFHTPSSMLACGASDGTIQVWKCDSESVNEETKAEADALGYELITTVNAKTTAVNCLLFHPVEGVLAIGYTSHHVEVLAIGKDHSVMTLASTNVPDGFTLSAPLVFGPNAQTLVVLLEDEHVGLAINLFIFSDNSNRFCTPLELPSATLAYAHVVDHMLVLYSSALTGRTLAHLAVSDDVVLSDTTPRRSWSSTIELSFGQYCHVEHLPDSVVQIVYSQEASRFELSQLSLKTNDRVTVATVPSSYENSSITPERIVVSPDLTIYGSLLHSSAGCYVLWLSSAASSAFYDVLDAIWTSSGDLLTLLPSGRSFRCHDRLTATTAMPTTPQGSLIQLPIPVTRIFATRLPILSSFSSSAASKLVFLVRDAVQDTLRLSDDSTLAFSVDSTLLWTTHKNESVLDVRMEPSTQTASSHHIAVLTTQRVVILDASLVAVVVHAPSNPLLHAPTSILWIGSAIAFSTVSGAILYFPTQRQHRSPLLLCSLAKAESIQLVACLPDRLIYVTTAATAMIQTWTRPFSVVEVLALSQPDLDLTRSFVHRELECSPQVCLSHALLADLSAQDMDLALVAATGVPSTGSFRTTSHIATSVVCSLYLGLHKWSEALNHALSDDPPLQEYASDPMTAAAAQLPQRLSVLSSQLSHIGRILERFGQFQTAARCYDIAGHDKALVELMLKCGDVDSTLVNSLANAPARAAMTCSKQANLAPRADAFRLLCTEHLEFERRSRLLPSLSLRQAQLKLTEETPAPALSYSSWKYFMWKRIMPEDMNEWVGSGTPHYSAEEFQPKRRAAQLSVDTKQMSFEEPKAMAPSIGPFLEEEDGVVAYWRFEDAATNFDASKETQFVDTSKRENHITVSAGMELVPSTAPVDRGEENKMQLPYALRFPQTSSGVCGGKAMVKKGNTLDIGSGFDEDPYRRCLTIECWVKNDTATGDTSPSGVLFRRSTAASSIIWSFGLNSGSLIFFLRGSTVKSDATAFKPTDAWQHIAAVVDITSDDCASIRLAVDGRHVVSKDVLTKLPPYEDNDGSTLEVGPDLSGFEMTEIRIWATARSEQQLADMKENYLSMAETKKKIKMKIHQRDCQCEKCIGRRQNTPIAKLAMMQPLSLTPTSRDRRQRMGGAKTPQTASPMNKTEETRI